AGIAFARLSYIECSNGFQYPQLEGGRTELEFADVNNDGNVDILSIGDHGSPYINTEEHGVMVWFGNGQGTWSVYQYGNFGYGGIAIGDVNWDGYWDVGYGMHHNYSGEDLGNDMLEVALGDGTGRFWTAWDDSLMPGGACWGMFSTDFADVDHDGDLDVGSCSFGSGVGLRVYLNLGTGTWRKSFGTPESINSNMEFYFRDVNRDGNPDIICATGGAAVYFGDGTGGFYPGDSGLPRSNYGLYGISPGDVDNDGGFDVAFCNSQGGVEVWVYNDSAQIWQTFSNGLPASGNYRGTQLCDMNCDGFVDVLALGGGHLTVWTGNGQGNWTQAADITTNSPGRYQAFRTGADFDHNGRPDMAIIIEEGTWPNYRNWAHAYKETTPRESLRIFPVFPRGGERFWNNSVQFIDWWSEAPLAESSRVRIELSTTGPQGPWQMIADSLRNNGRFQWLVPESVSSRECYLRYTVFQGGEAASALTPRPFFIGNPTGIFEESEPHRDQKNQIVPNPAKGKIRIVFGQALNRGERLKVCDVSGRVVKEVEIIAGETEASVDVSNLTTGTYFLVQKNQRSGRFVIQK
ncbi:MAG: T9SS type A sorting domain-containing protein, partial [candidate division WOR-3 bacterium]